jgi:alkanesulfonate monooxygenase SsuD/methylene tetrahydromethanopterin reductase-like flavin-dependent oxidoreductase (luciferase family)
MNETIESVEEAAETQGRKMDSELKVMAAIIRLLDDEDEAARARIVAYISARFAK